MRRTAVPLVLLFAALAAQPAASKQRAPLKLTGTATLRAVPLAGCTRADATGAKVVECEGSGTYRGTPMRGTVKYTWHWHLFHGGDVPQTAHGDEDGRLVLRLGTRGTVTLVTSGAKSGATSTGTWRYVSGTKQFKGRRGAGTYRFSTTSGAAGFSGARVLVTGMLL
jgi:hypothetical protein